MRYLLCIAIIAFGCSALRAQSNNKEDSIPPLPQGQQGWVQIPVPTTHPMLGICGTQSDTVWAEAEDAFLRSTDRGVTWVKALFPPAPGDNAFINSHYGFLTHGTTVYRTEDGGLSWNSSTVPINLMGLLNPVSFDTIFGGYLSYIIRSVDSGKTWKVTQLPVQSLNAMSFSDSKHGFVVGSHQVVLPDSPQVAAVYRTTDGGANWISLYSGLPYDLEAVAHPSSNLVISAGSSGHIARSTDAGLHWHDTLVTKGGVGPEGLSFWDSVEGIAVADLGVVFITSDGGITWQKEQTPATATLYQATFLDDSTIIVVGDHGTVLRTTNKGSSWVQSSQPTAILDVQVSPNPSSGNTEFSFSLPQPQHVSFGVYDLNGRNVAQLANGILMQGHSHLRFSTQNFPSGTYFFKFSTEKYECSGSFQIVK